MDKRIESYLDSVIPEKLSKRRQKLIREELRDHISDHIEFYTEIGYSEDVSIQKALADMGDDGGVTAMVKKDFEKVYGEKIWMPILAFVLTMLMLFAAIYCGVWILSADSKGSPGVFEVIASFAIILVMSFAMVFAYRKGLKKTLLAIGIPNLLFGATLISSGYTQPAIYALIYDVCLLLEETTPLTMYKVVDTAEYIVLIAGIAVDIGFAIVSVILYNRLRKNGVPEKSGKKKIIITASVLCAAAICLTLAYGKSENYFNKYEYVMNGYKFETSDGICKQSEAVFDSIELGMSYDEAKLKLRVQGYMPFDEYCETQSGGMRKRLKYSLNELDLAVTDEGYTVFVNPNVFYDYSGIDGRNYSNGFVYIRADSDGCVESKGVGSGTKPGDGSYSVTFSSDDHSDGITEGIVENCSVSSKFFTLKDGVTTRKYVVTPGRPYRIEDML